MQEYNYNKVILTMQNRELMSIVFIMFGWSWLAILYVDRDLTIFLHAIGSDQWLYLRMLTEVLPSFILCSVIVAILYKIWDQHNIILSIVVAIICNLYFYIMLLLTLQVKSVLKIIFGRYWPATWINNNLSLLHDGVYGFNWWHGIGNMGCFPSGHSTLVFFCLVWLSRVYPQLTKFLLMLCLFVVISLVLLNYHYLGDCLAGIGLGLLCGNLSVEIINRLIKTQKSS